MGPVTSEQGAETRTPTKALPLAHEVPVVATGARPGDQSEKRELFSEATQTVLVFEHGCVIPLSAAVAIGQLLFLTNKVTGREIVTQVVRKKDFKPTACYVELEFTEAAPGYWGVEFPAANVEGNQEALKGGIPEAFEEAETTEEGVGQGQHARADVAEVARLRQEVEALKAQLKSLAPAVEEAKSAPVVEQAKPDEAKPEEAKPAEMKLAEAQREESRPVEEKPIEIRPPYAKPEVNEKVEEAKPADVKIELMSPHEPKPEVAAPAVVVPEAPKQEATAWPAVSQELQQSASYPIRMQLPKATGEANRTTEFAADDAAAEHLLPKPNLDFAHYPGSQEPSPKLYSRSARRGLAGPIGLLVVAVLLLVAVGITTYRMGWLSRSAKKNDNAAMFPVNGDNTNGKAESGQVTEATKTDAPPIEKSVTAPTLTPEVTTAHHDAEIEHPAEVTRKPAERAPVERKSSKHTPTVRERGTDSSPTGSGDDVVIPPKLLKAIRSLSPPEALRAYASGVVVLDTLVDENGKVASATPISGPKALYPKAVDTVKEYVYQPATKSGKPVPAHVQVKIQFWYEP